NRTVCERLAGSDLYAFAWIGQYDTRSNTVVPQEWAGVDSEYLEGLSIATDEGSTGPIGTALRTGELQVTEDILTDPTFAPWREETLAEGVRSCVAIPLVYEKSPYGVLTVYASCPQSDERDYTVLAELGETIAHAIDTVETKRTLQTDSVAELELRISAPEDVLCRLAGETGCRIEFEGLVPGSDGTAQIFFTARGASIEEILTHGAHSIAIEELTCLADHGENSAFKAVCSGRSLPMVLIERDGAIRSLSIDGDSGRAIIDLPATTETREFIETLQGQYPQTELLARRSRDRPATTRHELRTAFEERLTERQQEVLRTAYLSGFFESPRESTGQEVTASLGISQPTFIQHLRASQRKIFEMVFDET
ncbi:MAG: GAF domain-containing protein, partial [Euryarchaeota archaeon]|nr:GAF domain-containing protein [Euryarchaeota archaeon]